MLSGILNDERECIKMNEGASLWLKSCRDAGSWWWWC